MKKVTFIEGWAKHDPLFHKGDTFANHLKVNGIGNTIVENKKRHKRKKKRHENKI